MGALLKRWITYVKTIVWSQENDRTDEEKNIKNSFEQ